MGRSALKKDPELDFSHYLELAQQGDEEALIFLIEHTEKSLFRFCIYLTGNRTLSQDICQDAYVKVLENIKSLKNPSSFKAWLFQTAKNLYLNHVKSPKNSKYLELEDLAELASNSNMHLASEIRQSLAKLTEDERAVVLLIDLEEHSYSETAEIMGLSEEAVRSRLHRARQAFKILFK